MTTNTGVFLQARLASKRFPRKAIAPFGHSTVIEHAMARLATVRGVHVIVTDTASYDTLKPYADRFKWECYAGEPLDVMKRFIDAAHVYGVTTVVRACGDSPLVSAEQAEVLQWVHEWSVADVTMVMGCTPGTAVGIVNVAALERDWPLADDHEREHVTLATQRLGKVNMVWVRAEYPESVAIDYYSDLSRVEALMKRRYL